MAVNTFGPCRHVSKIANQLGDEGHGLGHGHGRGHPCMSGGRGGGDPPVIVARSWGVTTHHSVVEVEGFNVLKRYEHERTLLSCGNR